ncbi:MAG: cytochrome c [Pseudomonadota bacterium]|nr:cytochrome c [Pseudomonadota bacterium]
MATMPFKKIVVSIALAVGVGIGNQGVGAEAPPPQTLTPDEAFDAAKKEFGIDVKTVFSTRCAACHLGQGMQRGDGPMLAGTSLDFAKVIERIVKGKTPMPGFGGTLTDEQLMGLARYIVSLKPPTQ